MALCGTGLSQNVKSQVKSFHLVATFLGRLKLPQQAFMSWGKFPNKPRFSSRIQDKANRQLGVRGVCLGGAYSHYTS